LAAYIDGEGYIHITPPRRKHAGCLEVDIGNTDYRLLVWLKETFGGGISNVTVHSFRKKKMWRWEVSRHRAEEVLVGCLPFFIIKKEQAEIGIAFQRLIASQIVNGEARRGIKISQKAMEDRAQLSAMLKESRSIGTEKVVQ